MKKMAIVGLMGMLCCAAAFAAKPNQPGAKPGPRTEKRAPKLMTERARRAAERGPKMSARERRLLESVEEAESLRELMRLLPQVQAAPNVELRLALVDALEEQGPRAANALVPFIADPVEDVADAAFSAWTTVLEEVDPRRRAAVIVSAAQVLQPPAPPAAAVPVAPVVAPAQPVVAPTQPVVTPVAPATVPVVAP